MAGGWVQHYTLAFVVQTIEVPHHPFKKFLLLSFDSTKNPLPAKGGPLPPFRGTQSLLSFPATAVTNRNSLGEGNIFCPSLEGKGNRAQHGG